jgi:hypothetical protein
LNETRLTAPQNTHAPHDVVNRYLADGGSMAAFSFCPLAALLV